MNNQQTSIEQLMRQASAGDKGAYAAVLNQTTRILRPYLSKRLPSITDVDDVLQEILLSVHKARHTYDGLRPFKPWLFAIARYRLQDHLRKVYADHLRLAGDLSEADTEANFHDDAPLSCESLQREIERLSGNQPQILQLLHREGYTAKEVAGALNMKESAVKVAAHRAYKILCKKLAG